MTTIEIVSPTYFPPKNPQIPAFHRYRPNPDPRIVKILDKKVRTSMDDSTMDKIQKTTPHPSIPLSTWTKHTELPNVWVRQQTEGTTRPRTWDDVRLAPYAEMPDLSSQWSTEQARQIQQRMDEIEAITATMGGKHPMAASLHFPEVNAALRNGELPLTTMTQMTGIVDRISNRQVTHKAGFAELDQLVRPQDSTPAYHTVDFSKEETRAQRFAAIDAASKTIATFMQHIADKAGVPLSQVEQVLGKISDQQHAFITSSAASVSAVGVPGGGKSTALAGRLVNQYQQGIDVSKFEYISPTRASAHALISKVQQAAPLMKDFDTNKIQPKTPWSLGMSLLNKRTIAQGQQLVSPLQAMDKGKYANYRPMGGKSQVETNTLEDDVEKALKGGEEQYIAKLVNQYKVKNANVSELAKSFANTKNNRSLTDDYKTRLERGAKLFTQEKDTGLQSEDALFYAYVQSANMRAGFKVPGQTTPEYDRADTLHFTRKAAQQGLIKPLKGVYVDEFQGMPAEAVAMVAAITSPASHVSWAGDLSQKTVYNDDRVDEFVRRGMVSSRTHEQINLTGTYRMDPWNAAASNARSASPNLEGHPRSAYMTSVRDRNEWGRMPTFQHEENFQKLYQGELNRWFGQMQLTMKQVHSNMQQGLSPLHGAAMTPQEAPFIFATGGHRDEFAQNLQAYLTQNLGPTVGSQAYNQIYTSQTPTSSSAGLLHALTMDQVKGREFEAPISYVGRAGKWDPTGFDNQLFTMNSRAKGQQRFISAGQNIGTPYPTVPDYSPTGRPLPPGSMPFIQRMIDNAMYQQGLPVEAIDPEFASMATHPFVPDAQNALPQNSGILQQMAQFIKTVFSNNFYQPGVGDMPVIAPEGSIETEYDANAGEEGEKINYGKSYDLTPAGVAGDLEHKPDKGRIEHARRILQLMAAQGPKALEFVRTLNGQQTIGQDAIPSAEELLSSKTSPFSSFGKEIELPFMTGMDRSQYIPGGVPQYGKVPEDAHGNPIRALQAIVHPEKLLNSTIIEDAGKFMDQTGGNFRPALDSDGGLRDKSIKQRDKIRDIAMKIQIEQSLSRSKSSPPPANEQGRQYSTLLPSSVRLRLLQTQYQKALAKNDEIEQEIAKVRALPGAGISLVPKILGDMPEKDWGTETNLATEFVEFDNSKRAKRLLMHMLTKPAFRAHPQGYEMLRAQLANNTVINAVHHAFVGKGEKSPFEGIKQEHDRLMKQAYDFEAMRGSAKGDSTILPLLFAHAAQQTRRQAQAVGGDDAFANIIADLAEGKGASSSVQNLIWNKAAGQIAYTDLNAGKMDDIREIARQIGDDDRYHPRDRSWYPYAAEQVHMLHSTESSWSDEAHPPIVMTEQMRARLAQDDPMQAHLFNTIVKEQKGDILLESKAIQNLISERAHAPALAQKVIGTKGEKLSITPAMSRISPFVTEVQNYAQRLMSTEHGGIVDPMAGVMKHGEFHPLGAGVSLGGYEKRLKEMLGRGGFEDPHAREGMESHLAQVQQIRGVLSDPSMQEQMGHFLHLASRVSTGMGADDPTLTEAQRKEAQRTRNTPLDRFFAPQRNQFGSGQRSLEGVGAYLSSVMQAMEHVQRTGTIKRGHINQLLGAMGHDVNGKLFAGLRHFEKQGRFTGPEDTLSLDELLNESTRDRINRAQEYTRYPIHPGEEVVFTGTPMGHQQQGAEGVVGTLLPAPKISYSQLQEFVKGGAYDYSELPSQRFGSAENFGNLSHPFYNLLTDEQKRAINAAAQRDKVKNLAMATEPMYLMQQTGVMGFTTQMPVLASQVMPRRIYDRLQGGESFGSLHPSSRVVEADPGSGARPDILPVLAQRQAQRQDMLRLLSLGRHIRQAPSVPTTSPRASLTSEMKAQLLSSLMTTRKKAFTPRTTRALQRATSTSLSDAGPAPVRPTHPHSFLNVLAPGLRPIHLSGERQRLIPQQASSLLRSGRSSLNRLTPGTDPIGLLGNQVLNTGISPFLQGHLAQYQPPVRPPEEPGWLKEQMSQVAPEAFGSVVSSIQMPKSDGLRLLAHQANVIMRSMADYGPVGNTIQAQANTGSPPHVSGIRGSSYGDPNATPSTEDIMRDIHRWNREGNLARGIYPPSDEQLGVLDDPSHHKIIEGGPGGGKTATLDRAIMDLIASGEVHPNQVKLLSAMHSGTEALNKGFDPYRDLMPKGHQYQFNPAQTFHSLAAEIVLRQDDQGNYPVLQQLGLGHLTGNILEEPNEDARESMTPEQWEDALTRAPSTHYQAFMANRGLSISREEALKHLNTINEIKNQRGTPDSAYDAMMLQGRATLTDPHGPMTLEAKLALYEQGIHAEGNIDYGDLPYIAHRALDELGPKALSDKILNTRVFGLDEAQDATTMNASLFQKTLSHMQDVGINPRVFVGMDRMQSLMQGLGGIDKEQVLGAFQGMLGVSNIHQLTKNFRSDAGTVALNNALLQHPLLKGRAMSPEQVPVNQNMGKPIDFSGLAKSQPTMYKNMFHSMMKASGISLGNVATNIAQGKHALDGMGWSNGGTKPSQVPAILSSRRQQKLFAQVAKQELQGSGLSRGDAAKAYSQMFRRNMPGKLTSRADREQAKTQFPVIRVGGSRSFEFQQPHVDVSRIEGWASNNDETARDYLSNVFTANSRTAQGGQLHVFAASHPFSRQQQNYYAQHPDSLVESSPGADPGLVSLTGGPQGQAVRHSPLNAFEQYNGMHVPAEFSALLQRQQAQIDDWQGNGLLPSQVVNSTLASSPSSLGGASRKKGFTPLHAFAPGQVLSRANYLASFLQDIRKGPLPGGPLPDWQASAQQALSAYQQQPDDQSAMQAIIAHYGLQAAQHQQKQTPSPWPQDLHGHIRDLQGASSYLKQTLAPPPRVTNPTSASGPVTINTPNVQVNLPGGGSVTVNRGNTPPPSSGSAPSPVTSVPAGTGATVGNTPLFTGQPIGPMNGRSRPGSMGMMPYSANAGMATQVGNGGNNNGGGGANNTPFGKFNNTESQLGHSLARIGGELQFLGQLGSSIIDASVRQGSEYRQATIPVSGGNGTQGFFDFSSSQGGINAYSHTTVPMYSNTQVARAIQSLTGITNTSFSPNSTIPALTDILGLSAMTGMDSSSLMNQMTGIQGSVGGNVLSSLPNMTGMLSGLYGNNLTEGNVSPTLSALSGILPTVQGMSAGGSGGMAQVMAFYKLALGAGMTSNNLGGVSDVLGSLSGMGNNPNLQQQYMLGQMFGFNTLTGATDIAQYQSQQTNEAQALAVNRLQQNIGGGLSLPNLQIKISQANIQMQQAQLTMSEAQLQASTVQQQQAQLQQNYNVASFAEQQSIANQTYGPIGMDSSKTAYFSWLRSRNAAQYNGTSPEVATQFQSAPTFGLQNAEFYAGLEHQRTQMVLSRSPLLSDMAFQENNKYINQQEAFYQAQLKLTNQQRQFEMDWQPKLLAGNQKVLDVNKSMLALQAQELEIQQQQFTLQQAMAIYEQKNDAITQQYLKQQGSDLAYLMLQQQQKLLGVGPVNGQNVQPSQIVQALANQHFTDPVLRQQINAMGLPTDQQQTLFLLVRQLQKSGKIGDIEKQLSGKGDKALQGNLQALIKNGAFASAQDTASGANAALNYAGTGAQWTALTNALDLSNKSTEALAKEFAFTSPFVLAVEKIANIMGPLAMAVASIVNIMGTWKALFPNGFPGTGTASPGGNLSPTGVSGGTSGGTGTATPGNYTEPSAYGPEPTTQSTPAGVTGAPPMVAGMYPDAPQISGSGIVTVGGKKYMRMPDFKHKGQFLYYPLTLDKHPNALSRFSDVAADSAGNTDTINGWQRLTADPNFTYYQQGGQGQTWSQINAPPPRPLITTRPVTPFVPPAPPRSSNGGNIPKHGGMAVPYHPVAPTLTKEQTADWTKWWRDRAGDWNHWWGDRNKDWDKWWRDRATDWKNFWNTAGKWLHDTIVVTLGNWKDQFGRWLTDRATDWSHWWTDRTTDWSHWWNDRGNDWKTWWADRSTDFQHWLSDIGSGFHGIIKTIGDDFSKLFDPKKGLLGKVLGIFGGNSGGAMGEAGPSVVSHGGFITPNVNADFHQKMNYGIHQGVDFQAAQGTPLEAFDGGKIVGSGFYPWGGEIDVDIGAGLIERYLHLSLLGAQVGQQVRKGQRIGLTGGGTPASGLGYWSSGAHSHVQIDQGDINAGLNPWPIWAMMGDNNISQYYNGSGVLDGPTTGARVHAGGARLSSSERMHHLSEGGIAMTRMRTELAEREPEAVVPLSKLASVLNGKSSGSMVSSPPTQKVVTISKIAERLELHVHTTAQKLDEQAQDDLMAQLLDIFKNAIEDMNGKST